MVKTHLQGDYRYQDPENEAETQSELHSHAGGGDQTPQENLLGWGHQEEDPCITTRVRAPTPARRTAKKPALRELRDRPKRGSHYMWTASERAHAVW